MAARRRVSTFRAKVQEELICAICLDFLQEPKILGCAHSFCQRCLIGIVNTGSSYKYGPNGKLAKDEVECPSCREITLIPGGKVSELKTNCNLKTLVNVVSEDEKKIARDAILSRKRTRPSVRVGKAPSLCTFHGRQLEYYCLECFEPLCPKCIGTGHKGHDFKDIDEVLPEQISSLRALIQPACEIALRAESTLKRLLEEKDKATENLYITTDSIKSFFEQVRKALEQREKALMATTRKYVDIKLTRLDVHYRMLEQHRVSILDQVTAIEQLIEGNDNVALLQQQQSISEDLEVHEQSIMTLCDMLSESQQSASLSFQMKKEITARVSTLGVLSECHTDPDTMMEIEYRRVLISEEDDPYLAVPLRFEDVETKTPQEEMRFEQSLKVEYEPENKPKAYSADGTYDTPRPISVPQLPLQHSGVSSEKPVPPARKRLTNTIGSRSSVSNTSLKEDLKMCKTPTVLSRSSSLATKHYDIPSHRIPAPDYSNYDVPKFTSLPPHFSRELTKPYTQHRSESKERHRSTSSDEYEPLDDIVRPSPAPRNLPPPIPPNHPSLLKEPEKVKPIPKPRKRSGTEAIPMTTTVQQRRKRRSHTLPAYSPGYHAIIPPIMVISNDMLSSPNSQESVYPVGICCYAGSEDTVIVTDTYNHCLRKINRNGTFIEKIGKEGRSGGQFKEPSAVTVDAKNHIYVVERDNPRVQKFSSSGKYVSKFGHKTLLGSLLNDPMGIAMSRNGCIVVSDWDKGQILFFANNGKLVNTLGKRGELFKFPAGIAFDSKGNLFVVDRGNHCVWILSANGKIIRKFAKRGSNFGELYYPYGIAVTEDNIIVSESGNNRVSLFTLTGDFLRCFGSFGSKPGLFDHPRHICVNSKKQLLVADEMNQRVQVFQL